MKKREVDADLKQRARSGERGLIVLWVLEFRERCEPTPVREGRASER